MRQQNNYLTRLSELILVTLCVSSILSCFSAGSRDNNAPSFGYTSSSVEQTGADHEHLCHEDEYISTTDLPIFIEKRRICNKFDDTPVSVYSIKTDPPIGVQDQNYKLECCLIGDFAEQFGITELGDREKEIKLFSQLNNLTETHLILQIIKINDTAEKSERRKAINAIQFNLVIEDCYQVSWQTVAIAVLSSICVCLLSTLAIMLILYQQKGLIKTSKSGDEDDHEENTNEGLGRAQHQSDRSSDRYNDESFINPRRTSSYDFSTIAKAHNDTISERQMVETENL